MGGPTRVLGSHWSEQTSKTPIPDSGGEKSQMALCQSYLQDLVQAALNLFVI